LVPFKIFDFNKQEGASSIRTLAAHRIIAAQGIRLKTSFLLARAKVTNARAKRLIVTLLFPEGKQSVTMLLKSKILKDHACF